MKLARFFEKFDQLADAPNALAKMRELVLQLAVRGNLTEQDDNESSHPQLALAEDFRIRRGRRSEPDSEDVPFVVPTNWGWVAVGDSMNMINGRAFKPEEWTTEGTPIIRIQNLNNEAAPFNHCKIEIDTKVHVHNGDFLISWSGTPGTSFGAFIWNRGFAYLNQHIFRCELVEGVFQMEFLRLAVNARLDEMISHAQGAVGLRHITKGKLEGIRLPLPPLAEQKRIVAKVDELMALCDRLEALQQERNTRHAALARASLARFAEAPTPANLDFLFHNAYTITPADLRKAILTLAVQGKLVSQPEDGSASVELVSAGVDLKRWAVIDEEQRYEVPESWVWMRFAGVGEQRLGKMLDAAKNRGALKPYLRNTNVQWMRFELDDVKEMRVEEREENELRLKKGDLLVCEGGEPGRCAIWNDQVTEMYFQKAIHRIRPCAVILSEYLALNLQVDCRNDVLASYFTGATIKHLTGRSLSQYPIPIPPLAEQHRIVAKVDQLMALVNQLETQLTAAKATNSALLDAVVHELINPTAEVIDFPRAKRDPLADRAAIGCYVIQKMAGRRYFGRTAAMKLLYLAETHVGLNLGGKPLRDAAGPFDQWIYRFEKEGGQEKWFKTIEGSTSEGHKKIEYRPESALTAKAALAESAFTAAQGKEFDRLLTLFANRTTEEVEIIATLFAAWNDFLIDGHVPGDDEVVEEVRENWHAKKKRFTPTQLQQWLGWLRQNALIPKGRLPRTAHQSRLLLD